MSKPDIKNIVINYDNGESKTIDKGFVVGFEPVDNETVNIHYELCDIKNNELTAIVHSVAELADVLGMFDDMEEE